MSEAQGPAVTVVVAVYNTMPYLTRCLESLVAQTIGAGQLEVIAVDDGSTDGGGAELDRFARLHPDIFTVLHQPNSGGPAVPSNRALDQANGRYVFFLGADDYLGPEALERLVTTADRLGSDVVLGRVVGVNSRHVDQTVFAADADDLDLFDSALPYAMANTKLFRRALIEKHGLRFPEGMRVLSDQPFTIEACFHARRISVRADYDYYYAVRRLDSSNVSYGSRASVRVEALTQLISFIAALVPAGERRDAILTRHFRWELTALVGDQLRKADAGSLERIVAGIGALVREYLTDRIRARLTAETRVRLAVAAHADAAALLAVIRQDAEVGVPATVTDGDRSYAAYPGFRTAGGPPDACFDVTGAPDWPAKLDVTAVTWARGRALEVRCHSPRTDLADPVVIGAGDVTATAAVDGGHVLARLSAKELLATSSVRGERRALTATVGDGTAPLRAPGFRAPRPVVRIRASRVYVLAVTLDHTGQVMIGVTPVTVGRVVAHLKKRVKLRLGK
ncbi:glycosyltransferase [Asanoa sp. NPDC050611]|uniref:glycosyltransferase family 2 protein n=1 Tax=Asanoa sp. NPDC050611 TaxID=3157098 RepID=UPI0033DA55AA